MEATINQTTLSDIKVNEVTTPDKREFVTLFQDGKTIFVEKAALSMLMVTFSNLV